MDWDELKMSLLELYRRNVNRKQQEIAKLQQQKAKEKAKAAGLTAKKTSATQALSRSSTNTAKSKLGEIERHEKAWWR